MSEEKRKSQKNFFKLGDMHLLRFSDKFLNLWDLKTGNNLAAFSGEGAIFCVAVSPDGKKVVA